MTWYYEGDVIIEAPEDFEAFVYEITNLQSGKKYLGKKKLWRKVTKPPLKGQKRKRRSRVPSDWPDYYGSSDNVKEDLAKLGASNFKREVLRWCKTPAEASYFEAKMQFDRDVLLSDDYYNGIINCRINRSHIRKALGKS
jgi:hypothetical protein